MVLGGRDFGRWWGHEGEALINGMCPYKVPHSASQPLPPSEDNGKLMTQKRALIQLHWHPDLGCQPAELREISVWCLQATQFRLFCRSTPKYWDRCTVGKCFNVFFQITIFNGMQFIGYIVCIFYFLCIMMVWHLNKPFWLGRDCSTQG